MENSNKKSLKGLWIAIAIVVVVALVAWLVHNANQSDKGVDSVFKISALLFGIFVITALGYLLGRVTIKGVSLGTAGVFLVAILFGFVCSQDFIKDIPVLKYLYLQPSGPILAGTAMKYTAFYKDVISNIGLVLFVGSVGFIAGPNFFKDLKKNFKTYILLGIIIILSGTLVAVILTLVTDYGSGFWSGVLSGALTSTPGYSAAVEAAAIKGISDTLVTVGHAIAYPFGVIGVVLFVQLLPKFLKADMAKERALLKVNAPLEHKKLDGLFECDTLGLTPLALAILSGLLLGAIKIPITAGATFSLGTTGGVLIMGLVFGHFGRIGKMSLKVPEATTKVLKELGLMLFLIGAGVEGGVNLVSAIAGDSGIVVWGFIGGAIMTLVPMIVGFFIAKYILKIYLLNTLGSITGGMTSTPALGTLISTAGTEDVASAYASTYPIALILIVLACNLMIGLI